jgi:hypothetical protein
LQNALDIAGAQRLGVSQSQTNSGNTNAQQRGNAQTPAQKTFWWHPPRALWKTAHVRPAARWRYLPCRIEAGQAEQAAYRLEITLELIFS